MNAISNVLSLSTISTRDALRKLGKDMAKEDDDVTDTPSEATESEYEESSDDDEAPNCITRTRAAVIRTTNICRKTTGVLFWLLLAVIYYLYFGYSLYKTFDASDEDSWRFLVVTVVVSLSAVAYLMSQNCSALRRCQLPFAIDMNGRAMRIALKIFTWIAVIGTFIFIIAYVIVNVVRERPDNLTSMVGIAVFLLLPWIGSKHPARVRWRPVFWGVALQFYLLVLLRWRYGYQAFVWLGKRVQEFLKHAEAGSLFLFGETYGDHYFALHVLVIVVYSSAFIYVLYYLGVVQFIIEYIAKFLAFCQGTSPLESLAAAANIFLGPGETAMTLRPFVKAMTRSEIHATCSLGFATIASSVIGAYIAFGIPANHLVTASIMSAPAGLAIAKLFYPDTKRPKDQDGDPYLIPKGVERNILDALLKGAEMSMGLVANIAVSFISCLAAIRFVDMTLIWLGHRAGMHDPEITFTWICSYLFYPIAWVMGVPSHDCRLVGSLLGTKTVLNEFIAYRELSLIMVDTNVYNTYMQNATGTNNGTSVVGGRTVLNYDGTALEHGILGDRSIVIAIYGLCGFSNISCIGMNIAIISAVAPTRRRDASKIMIRAMIAGCLTDFMTASVAGLMYDGPV